MEYRYFTNVGKNILYVSTIGIASIYIAKTMIRKQRADKFNPNVKTSEEFKIEKSDEDDYYSNVGQIKPGFPIPRKQASPFEVESDESSERKSKYEGPGLSALARKRGDKLNYFARRKNKEEVVED